MSYRSNNSVNLKTIALIFLFGMAFGYIAGLWQQAAQYHRRMLIEASENSFLKD